MGVNFGVSLINPIYTPFFAPPMIVMKLFCPELDG